MKDRSTMGPIEYISESVFWGLISMIWYKNILFHCLPNLTYETSRAVLWSMLLASIVVCSGYFFRKKRTGWSILVSLLFPYGLYTIGAYWKTFQNRIVIVLVSSTVISFLLGILVITRRINRRKSLKRVIVKRIQRWASTTGTIFSIAMAVIMVPLLLQGAFGMTLFKSSVEANIGIGTEEQTISNNIDMVLKLQAEEWCSLSTNEKLNVLQCVANIEAHYLGISNELNVGASNLPEYTLACYSDASHTIYLNLEHLENDPVDEVLNSCCHEAYHSYQHRLVDAYNEASEDVQKLRVYKNTVHYVDEFGAYVDGYEDFCSYYSQQCEKDARTYAEDAVEDYYSRIDEYLNSDSEQKDGMFIGSYLKQYSVEVSPEGEFLLDPDGNNIAGPYRKVYADDLKWCWDETCRYEDANGMLGYLAPDGKELTSALFVEASEMSDGKARVGEKSGGVYYINSSFERISDDYLDGFEYEHQSLFARVQLEDKTWGIIDRHGDLVLEGADSIQPLPLVTVYGSAIIGGKACLLELDLDTAEQIKIVKEFDEFCEISEVYYGLFATVINSEGMIGVVDCTGDVVIPAQYKSIDYEVIFHEESVWVGDDIVFHCYEENGLEKIIEKKW